MQTTERRLTKAQKETSKRSRRYGHTLKDVDAGIEFGATYMSGTEDKRPRKRKNALLISKMRRGKLKDIEADTTFGTVYKGFRSKPKEAIEFLAKRKEGEIPDALYRKDIGYVSLVWGTTGTKEKQYRDGYGLAHIYREHEAELRQIGASVSDVVATTFFLGTIAHYRSQKPSRIYMQGDKFALVISTKWFDKNRKVVLTSFDLRPIAKKNPIRAAQLKKASRKSGKPTPKLP